jgi:hypothetical protein
MTSALLDHLRVFDARSHWVDLVPKNIEIAARAMALDVDEFWQVVPDNLLLVTRWLGDNVSPAFFVPDESHTYIVDRVTDIKRMICSRNITQF